MDRLWNAVPARIGSFFVEGSPLQGWDSSCNRFICNKNHNRSHGRWLENTRQFHDILNYFLDSPTKSIRFHVNMERFFRNVATAMCIRIYIYVYIYTIYIQYIHTYVCVVGQSCLTLCDPMDGSPPGSSVHEILQARILEWVAISFSRGSSQPRDWTWVFHITGRCFTLWATREAYTHTHSLLLRELLDNILFMPSCLIFVD